MLPAVGLLALLMPACDHASAPPTTTESEPAPALLDVTQDERVDAERVSAMRLVVSDASAPAVATSRLDPPATVAPSQPALDIDVEFEPELEPEDEPLPSDREPLELRTAKQHLTVRIAPDHRAPIRARIASGEAFEVFERVQGRGCSVGGWADVGNGGFVCLSRTRPATQAPRMMPVARQGVLPFYFARNRLDQPARRWKSMRSYLRGDQPTMVYELGRDYAFTSRRREGGQIVLTDKRGRIMLERDLDRMRPSRFEGRDLVAEPVPEGEQLAWTVDWPRTAIHAAADPEAKSIATLDYHLEIFVRPEPLRTASGTWFELTGGGFVRARDIRRLQPVEPLADDEVTADELWIDVDLDQQVLTVVRGQTPIFTTLISSGLKGPTPRGVFRINKKEAFGSMTSSPGASEAYAVEAVPYVQYFHEGIALHSAYWHDRFGFKISHGCVNLSPRDAAHVYSLTGPHASKGWMEVFEDEGDLGTRVRVHEGREVVADRRGPVVYVEG
ncbi:L,D-transpeptidase [Paraliomyxa miuraensis]|uniref:L,D-transpeptidase n=1 Tax=Paraliomyxa miuraensis TaxID=376150 RepID=UPI0022573A72|nr:L,D-transpeptidase [Paraliomyxa miuraensis]MCX4246443.1 L,D-transpeptidase [Paraliomyxa miuraensis]